MWKIPLRNETLNPSVADVVNFEKWFIRSHHMTQKLVKAHDDSVHWSEYRQRNHESLAAQQLRDLLIGDP